jgi:hypothetical protein
MMETCLDEFVDVIHKRLSPSLGRNILNGFQQKPLSIFVCTDGRWAKDEDKAAGVQRPVQRLAEKVQQLKLGRTRVMLQFLRFGDDENGCRYLKYLDDMGEENGFDIVDSKAINSNVYSILVGSMGPENDKSNG